MNTVTPRHPINPRHQVAAMQSRAQAAAAEAAAALRDESAWDTETPSDTHAQQVLGNAIHCLTTALSRARRAQTKLETIRTIESHHKGHWAPPR